MERKVLDKVRRLFQNEVTAENLPWLVKQMSHIVSAVRQDDLKKYIREIRNGQHKSQEG